MAITYCIFCNISGEKYYGSTIQKLHKRISKHISEAKHNMYCSSKHIINRGDYEVYIIGEYKTEEEARMKEKWYIQNKPCINMRQVCVTPEERKKQRKKYSQENREEILRKKAVVVVCKYCGQNATVSHLARHQKSIKCLVSVSKALMPPCY
jgi:hypothetical protein